MSQLEKLLEQFISTPFPKWNGVLTLLKKLGYKKLEGDGSRLKCVNPEKKKYHRIAPAAPTERHKNLHPKRHHQKVKRKGVIK